MARLQDHRRPAAEHQGVRHLGERSSGRHDRSADHHGQARAVHDRRVSARLLRRSRRSPHHTPRAVRRLAAAGVHHDAQDRDGDVPVVDLRRPLGPRHVDVGRLLRGADDGLEVPVGDHVHGGRSPAVRHRVRLVGQHVSGVQQLPVRPARRRRLELRRAPPHRPQPLRLQQPDDQEVSEREARRDGVVRPAVQLAVRQPRQRRPHRLRADDDRLPREARLRRHLRDGRRRGRRSVDAAVAQGGADLRTLRVLVQADV